MNDAQPTDNLSQFQGLRMGVVASLKKGMEQFIYREVSHMARCGAAISLFPTKQGTGLYAPDASWNLVSWSVWSLLMAQPIAFLRQPWRYFKSLCIAIRCGAVPDFALAARFSMQFRAVDAIYSTFGDRKLFVGYFGKLLTGKPLLCNVHAYELYANPNRALFRRAIECCDQLLTVSEFNRQYLHKQFDFPPDRVKVITYSIDLNEYRPAEKFVVLIVGFFVARKGHEVLFRAVKSLNNPNIEIWVVGGQGAESESVDVKSLASQLGISDQVSFFGKQSGNALRSLYHACDVFCLPCHFDSSGVGEGFPNVIIEAMATGKPVIASQHVGIPEILESYCIPEKDCQGVAQAIDELYRSPQLRTQQGLHNRKLAETHFSPMNVRELLEIAQQCAQTSKSTH
ncbi:MAG: glycosyltransferase family 4 protein [Pirellulaceae bacterium]|nr:glycosyltransferase family 4 protein [Pirellulaceae bacterium]